MSLLDTHLSFVAALRRAGLSVSLAEGMDAVDALGRIGWHDRETVRTAYAATLVKRQSQRVTFDAIFDVFYPRMVGDGVAADQVDEGEGAVATATTSRDSADALNRLRQQILEAIGSADVDEQLLLDLAAEAVARFGAMPGRGPGLSSWSAYTTLQRVSPEQLTQQIVDALRAEGLSADDAERAAASRVSRFAGLIEGDARRRIVEEKGPDHVAQVVVRPTIDQLDFTAARKSDLEEMRRQLYPLTRRLATRLTREQHARRGGALDFRRTVRASLSTGGVPLETHHRPKRPHRSELVVLCDVSGSVANFAQFTLMLVFALREQFNKVRAFTFIDHVHEVTHHFTPGADVATVMADLAASTAHAALWGRTNYGRAFTTFAEQHADAIGPKTSLLVLGDARSNYSDLAAPVLKELVAGVRHAWWINPEHPRNWGAGDSAAPTYAEIVPMVECRNLTQLEQFVAQLAR